MAVSYDKLWKILNEKNMMKTDLVRAAKISTNAMAKLGRNEDVRVGILVKICEYLGCTIDDIMDIIPEEERQA
jgi:DNA (cytosine-5)-methyltransferase 1